MLGADKEQFRQRLSEFVRSRRIWMRICTLIGSVVFYVAFSAVQWGIFSSPPRVAIQPELQLIPTVGWLITLVLQLLSGLAYFRIAPDQQRAKASLLKRRSLRLFGVSLAIIVGCTALMAIIALSQPVSVVVWLAFGMWWLNTLLLHGAAVLNDLGHMDSSYVQLGLPYLLQQQFLDQYVDAPDDQVVEKPKRRIAMRLGDDGELIPDDTVPQPQKRKLRQ